MCQRSEFELKRQTSKFVVRNLKQLQTSEKHILALLLLFPAQLVKERSQIEMVKVPSRQRFCERRKSVFGIGQLTPLA